MGALTEGERAPAETKEGPQREEPRGGLPNLQSPPAFRPQTSLQDDTLGDLKIPAKSKHVPRLSAVYCLADALALP